MDLPMRKILRTDLIALTNFFIANKDVNFFDPFPLNEESAKKIINSENNDLFYGIFAGDRIVGFGMLRWYRHYKSPTLGLIVDKNYQGFGFGKKIYTYLFARAKEAGAKDVIAIVHKNNEPSRHIAEKLGMEYLSPESLSREDRYDFKDYTLINRDKLILVKKIMKPKLGVCMITYNQETFIAQAIEGVMMQKADFDFELIIGEDFSTDRTRQIVLEYKKKYPDKIRLLLRESNYGMMRNFVETLRAGDGEYIAVCEGDDYWTDPNKLQKQVDWLENNRGYSICSHGVRIVYQGTNKPSQIWSREWIKKGEATIEEIINSGGGATCSLVFRSQVLEDLPGWYQEQRGGDWSLQILCASQGRMKYIPDIMGVYRVHAGGTYSAAVKEAGRKNIGLIWYLYDNMRRMLEALDKHFDYQYRQLFNKIRGYNYLDTFSRYAISGDFKNSRKYLKKLWPFIFRFPIKTIFKVLVKMSIMTVLPKKYALVILHYNINKYQPLGSNRL